MDHNNNLIKSFIPTDEVVLGKYQSTEEMELKLQNNLQKGLISEETFHSSFESIDLLKGGKKALEGEIRTHGGIKVKKENGKWIPVKEEHSKDTKEIGEKKDFKKEEEVILGKTKNGKIIYKNHEFKMYSYPGRWHNEKVLKVDKEGYHTTGHNIAIPHDKFHSAIDQGEEVKESGKEHKDHKVGYFLSNHGEEKKSNDSRNKIKTESKEDKTIGDKKEVESLGKTTSGKEVFNKFDHPSHKDFTDQDHKEAADLNNQRSKSERKK